MNHNDLIKKLHTIWNRRGLPCFVLAAMVCVSVITMSHADALYILTSEDGAAIVLDEDAQVEDFSSQLVYVTSGSHGYDVTLAPQQTVTIRHGGASTSVQSKEETISALLDRLHMDLDPLDMVAVDLSGDGAILTVDNEITYYDQVTEAVAYQTQRVPNPELSQGTEQVIQPGVDGVRTAVYEVVWAGGELISRQFVEELDSTAVEEIVEYGTNADIIAPSDRIANITRNEDGSGTLVFQSGATLRFSDAKSMTATAYTAGHGGADTCTATGTFVRKGVVAVDKKVIPLGTKMYIVTNDGIVYGMGTAEDTGVRGDVVDLYHDTYDQCINFGRRGCTVYILD